MTGGSVCFMGNRKHVQVHGFPSNVLERSWKNRKPSTHNLVFFKDPVCLGEPVRYRQGEIIPERFGTPRDSQIFWEFFSG